VTAGTIAGLVVWQLAGKAVKERGGGEVASRLAAVAAHAATATVTGWTVNALVFVDVTGAPVTPAASGMTAVGHGLIGTDAIQGAMPDFLGGDGNLFGSENRFNTDLQTSSDHEVRSDAAGKFVDKQTNRWTITRLRRLRNRPNKHPH
jgi:hypothetical protein